MRSAARRSLAVAATVLAASAAIAQVPAGSPRPGVPAPAPPAEVSGYIATVQVQALGRDLKPTGATAPEAQEMLGTLEASTSVVSRFYLAQDLSRQEIVSTDFVLPAGTVVLHRAGDKAYVVADPATRTYAVMDAEPLLAALEGGAGILNSQYAAKVLHTDERKMIAGLQRSWTRRCSAYPRRVIAAWSGCPFSARRGSAYQPRRSWRRCKAMAAASSATANARSASASAAAGLQ